MTYEKPVEKEYKTEKDGICHLPTCSRFYPHAGMDELQLVELGKLGSMLENGDDYRQSEVEEMAVKLWALRRK